MPWECRSCGTSLADDVSGCPSCSVNKTTWTIIEDKTRLFVLKVKKFTLQKGDKTRTYAADDPDGQLVSLSPAEQITVLAKSEVRDTYERGHLPQSAFVVFVTLHHGGATDLGVEVEPLFASQPSDLLEFPKEGSADTPDPDYVKFLFVYGDEPGIEDVSFPDIHIVDIGEDTEERCAPTVEFAALGKDAQELPAAIRQLKPFMWSDAPAPGSVKPKLREFAWSDAPCQERPAKAAEPQPVLREFAWSDAPCQDRPAKSA